MTESAWMECTDYKPMLDFLLGKASDRKLRLFAVACCRRIWHLISDDRSRNAVEWGEQLADGIVKSECLLEAVQGAIESSWEKQDARDIHWPVDWNQGKLAPAEAAEMAATCETGGKVWGSDGGYGSWEAALQALTHDGDEAVVAEEKAFFCTLLRDIFGNPCRPASIDPAWLTPTVTSLAQSAYDERILPSGELALDRLGVLSDALEESGCDNDDILNHLRSPGPHVRGCWVLDLLTGRS